VVRQSKAVLAAHTCSIPVTGSGNSGSARNSGSGSIEDAPAGGSIRTSSPAPLLEGAAAAANGYLAAAELVLQLKLPGLAGQLLELAAGGCCMQLGCVGDCCNKRTTTASMDCVAACSNCARRARCNQQSQASCNAQRFTAQRFTAAFLTQRGGCIIMWLAYYGSLCLLLPPPAGLKDPASQLARRMKLAHVAVAQQSGDTERALQLLRELEEAGGEDAKLQVQVLLGDVQYEVSSTRC
jgi:hypothetical protein